MKKFTYISDILKDKQFKMLLDDAIDEVVHHRNCALIRVESQNLTLGRNTFDSLTLRGLLSVEKLSAEFKLIQAGRSKISARERVFISSIVDEQIMKTIEYYKVNRIVRFWNRIINKFKK
jgi:hypothetical protein